ncbi:MAG: DUF3143 domain-containing protein [Cyanobacteriota bacterium]|nr:DUF3143 domain-containing protein [Cyanobacteriota bacterium]
MPALPDPATPLYNHPLPALEAWLRSLGAVQRPGHPCLWDLQHDGWQAEIELEVEELAVRWTQSDQRSLRQFPYGLSRRDMEAAILAGP